jgi:biotin-dependent carboxylase-like uncharacterized protein
VITVLAAGPLTTVQDAGRAGWRAYGVPGAGPADWLSHTVANRLVGNPDGAAALECTLSGPRLRFGAAALVAVVGATATLDGEPLTSAGPHPVPAGATLAIGRTTPGVRAYLAVAGGLDVPPVLGSRSTDTLAGLGPPRLAPGTALPTGDPPPPAPRDSWVADTGRPLRVVPGPHQEWFAGDMPAGEYAVMPESDRVGVRLRGPAVERVAGAGELPVTGMVAGALQVPPDGQPILLLANHGPTGGYPVVGAVATADLPLAGQLRPGQQVRFVTVSVEQARQAYRDLRARLDAALPTARPG